MIKNKPNQKLSLLVFKLLIISSFMLSSLFSSPGNQGHHHEDHLSNSTSSSHQHASPKSHIPVVAEELDRVGIEENIGKYLDGELSFYNSKGEEVEIKDLGNGKPFILTFAYYSCPLICQFVLQAQKKAMDELTLQIGSDYNVVTVSFDEKDGQAATKNIKSRYANEKNKGDWNFLYGTADAIKRITDSVGFQFKWIEANQEFAHSAAIYIISPELQISRYFYGLNYDPFEVKLALLEAKEEKSRSTIDKILLYCYRYDHEARGYVLQAWNVMKIGGVVTTVAMASFLFVMFRRERKIK